MSDTKVANLGLLLRCYEALRNWRALAMLVAGFVIAALLMALDGVIVTKLAMHGWFRFSEIVGIFFALIAALVVLTSLNGTGLLLVDQADAQPSRGFGAALFGGLGVTAQAIACLVALGLGVLLVVLILWSLSFLGRIPGIGPAFAFLLAGPTMLILAACYALLAFGVSLMLVALWRGHGMLGSLGRAIDLVVKRPLDVVLHFIVLALLIVPIEAFVAAVLFGGAVLTGAMYASGSVPQYSDDGPMAMIGAMLAGGGAPMGAAGASIGIVLAAVFALFVLISMLGNILIFDSLASDTDATSAGFLDAKVRQLRQKVEEHRPTQAPAPRPATTPASAPAYVAPTAAPAPQAAAPGAPPVATAPAAVPPVPVPATHCASCGATLIAGDRFCGGCGSPAG